MKKIETFNENEILEIKETSPEKLFFGESENDLKVIYRKLSALWHPDKHINDGKDTSKVFVHIKNLYESALKKLENGTLGLGLSIKFLGDDGKEFILKYQIEKLFELGKYYIANEYVVWCFEKEYENNAKEGIRKIDSLRFADDKMKKEFSKYIPKVIKVINTKEYFVVVMQKEKGFLNLQDVLNHYGSMDSKHVAWVMSTMYNLACFLKYNNLMQGGISIENYFINPENHEGYVIGGWWYSKHFGEKLEMLSTTAVDVAPVSLINKKKAEEGLDLEMIKLVGRTLLGDATGVYLSKNPNIHKRMILWLREATLGNSFKEYEVWMKEILKDSFGARRFIKMELTANDIYKGE